MSEDSSSEYTSSDDDCPASPTTEHTSLQHPSSVLLNSAEERDYEKQEPDFDIKHKDIVAMQRLAKKRKLFLIQKLTKRIKMLKNKKGNDVQLQKNQRKVDRMHQKISDLKEIDFAGVISDLIEKKFIVPDLSNGSDQETTREWFMFELTQDQASFMSYVKSLSSQSEDQIPAEMEDTSRKRKRNDGTRTSKSSSYSEKDDAVLNNILKPKKNRPGQRARQKEWEEVYGNKAKHLNKTKDRNQNTSTNREFGQRQRESSKPKREFNKPQRGEKEVAPQEIMRRLKEKDKLKSSQKEKEEHPSWLAKKQQSAQSSQIDVFAGTKITFSDDD